uniref:UBC core domain-containing protein n=2 Tax=Panagrolaimus sp. JU765 TaxID=591449 RepID=A0AC34QVQ5_9BILA
MLNLQKRIKGVDEDREYLGKRVNIRDKLLAQEINELQERLKEMPTCRLEFPNQKQLHEFYLKVAPTQGYYRGGVFKFHIMVPPEYNNVPPVVKCLTKVFHPNITEDGAICLSVLRQNTLDSFGWMPTRRLTDVLHGLNSLFTELIDFDDPLNVDAAKLFATSKDTFEHRVREYIQRYARA